MKENLICIRCPMGCMLEINYEENRIISVSGNRCQNGVKHAEKELFSPERIITTTVRMRDGIIPLLPVKTAAPVPKTMTFRIIEELSKLEITHEIKIGDIVYENILNTGINVVSCRTIQLKT
jgi:CxxC motif-containing protein